MNFYHYLIIIYCFSVSLNAQIEIKSIKKIDLSALSKNNDLKIIDENHIKKDIELPLTSNFISPKSYSGLNYKSKIDRENFGTLNPIKMEFGVAPTVNKYLTNKQPNYLKKEKGISTYFQRDQKLGDLYTNGKFLILSFRDYGDIDGDIIRLIVNDEEIVHRAILGSGFAKVKIELKNKGFYKIDFMALNMGQFAPNTAHLKVLDDSYNTIMNDKWALSTGFKATVIVIKE